jgi:DNA topoisomerase-2
MWIYENGTIIQKQITYTPGFYKIFDEILINARDASVNDPTCNKIEIEYNKEEKYISVYNNGDDGIPIEIHPKHNILVPTMIFGELLTSSNYNDSDNRTTGGRNGLGSKCLYEDTILYLFDFGKAILAKDIIIGDKIIGDDGNPRIVTNIMYGYDDLYKVTQQYGETYYVNRNHILTLYMPTHKKIIIKKNTAQLSWWCNERKCIITKYFKSNDNIIKLTSILEFQQTINDINIIDMNILDYIELPNEQKNLLFGIKGKCVKWEYKTVLLDSYLLGLNMGCDINNYETIPNEYIINSEDIRIDLLGGIIDINIMKNNKYIIIYNKKMADCIKFLIYSLGLYCPIKINYCGNHIFDFKQIECYFTKLSNRTDIPKITNTGNISVSKSNKNNFVGIEVDCNNRFVINDFTVTHNCANIFSNKFIVEINDYKRKKQYKQTWTNNMSLISEPIIEKLPPKTKSSIKITFYPDLEKFKIDNLDNYHYNLFYKRAIDIAGTTNNKLNILFNNEKINITNFKSYIDLYYPNTTVIYDNTIERWNIGIVYNNNINGEIISFVNGINTYKGGTHCNYVIDNIIKTVVNEFIKKKDKDFKINIPTIKSNFTFFINSIIVNPSFSSQTKDTLTTKPDNFGSKYECNATILKKISKCGIVEQMVALSKFKETNILKKTDGKKQIKISGIPKLEDANKAGSKDSFKCTLILTEGDSAKATAMAGISIVGRDYYGVFPLKGKLLNVREATTTQLSNNEEIKHLKTIIGLKQNENYSDIDKYKSLRYGHILLLTDSDTDGSHIKGLVINMFHYLWPELIKTENFIQSLNTPIIKATKNKIIIPFYNLSDYNKWKETEDSKKFKIKYYKGLGTSTSAEAKEYFTDIEKKLLYYNDKTDTDNAILLAFDKTKSNERKQWLSEYDKDNIISYDTKIIPYNDFINKDLIHFSNDDLIRSIPLVIDGFKPSQRKILYGAFLRGLDKDEVKVSQLAGFVSDKAAYHHGENSLNGAIVGMAQNFTGSNNINILKPVGQFGTKMKGGKDYASPRYIWTTFDDLTTLIFNPLDNPILINQYDDGILIEPMHYIPIIPMILVNGTEGIGTGFSTKIPPFNPIDIINNIKNIINNKKIQKMIPWWKNFKGKVVEIEENIYEIHGVYKIKKDKLIITELPIGEWTSNYKEFLEKILIDKKKDNSFISYTDSNTDTAVYFELTFKNDYLSDNIETTAKSFHLIKKYSTTNMHLYGNQ